MASHGIATTRPVPSYLLSPLGSQGGGQLFSTPDASADNLTKASQID